MKLEVKVKEEEKVEVKVKLLTIIRRVQQSKTVQQFVGSRAQRRDNL